MFANSQCDPLDFGLDFQDEGSSTLYTTATCVCATSCRQPNFEAVEQCFVITLDPLREQKREKFTHRQHFFPRDCRGAQSGCFTSKRGFRSRSCQEAKFENFLEQTRLLTFFSDSPTVHLTKTTFSE